MSEDFIERSAYYAPDPWAVKVNGNTTFFVYSKERIHLVKRMRDVAWLKDMLAWDTTQRKVKLAIQRRLKELA